MSSFAVYRLDRSQFEKLLSRVQSDGLVICRRLDGVDVTDPKTSGKLSIDELQEFPSHFGVFFSTRVKENRNLAARVQPLIVAVGGIEA